MMHRTLAVLKRMQTAVPYGLVRSQSDIMDVISKLEWIAVLRTGTFR